MFVVCCWLFVARCLWCVVCCLLGVCLLSGVCCLLCVDCCSVIDVWCLLCVVCCWLFDGSYLLFDQSSLLCGVCVAGAGVFVAMVVGVWRK